MKSSGNRWKHLQLNGAEGWMVSCHHETPCQAHQAPVPGAVSLFSHGLLPQAETDNLLLPDTCAAPDGYSLLSDYIKWSSSYIHAIGKEVWLNCNGFSAWEHFGSSSAMAQLIYCCFHTEKVFKNVIPSFASQNQIYTFSIDTWGFN